MIQAKKAYAMLDNENLWETAVRCQELLTAANIPYSVAGGVAVCLHGYQRNTTDLDLLIRSEDSAEVKAVLSDAAFEWDADEHEFRTQSGVAVLFLVAGDRAGRDSEVRLPDPAVDDNVTRIEDHPVLRLSRLIEIKLACGTGSMRRTHKDFADVVELIAIRQLDSGFAGYLHKSLRETFRQLVHRAEES